MCASAEHHDFRATERADDGFASVTGDGGFGKSGEFGVGHGASDGHRLGDGLEAAAEHNSQTRAEFAGTA